jgi:hypothetical protein
LFMDYSDSETNDDVCVKARALKKLKLLEEIIKESMK